MKESAQTIPVHFSGHLVVEQDDHHLLRPYEKKGPKHEKHDEEKPSPPLKSAVTAFQTAKSAVKKLEAGPTLPKHGPKDAGRYDVALLFRGKVVSRLRFDPSGNVLPKGFRFIAGTNTPARQKNNATKIKEKVQNQLFRLQFAPGLEADKKRGLWKLPLILENLIVAELFVSPDGKTLEEDAGAAKEVSEL